METLNPYIKWIAHLLMPGFGAGSAAMAVGMKPNEFGFWWLVLGGIIGGAAGSSTHIEWHPPSGGLLQWLLEGLSFLGPPPQCLSQPDHAINDGCRHCNDSNRTRKYLNHSTSTTLTTIELTHTVFDASGDLLMMFFLSLKSRYPAITASGYPRPQNQLAIAGKEP